MGRRFVLVHGAWHGGWCWQATAEILRGRGHRVTTPTLTGLGERAHLLSPAVDLETMISDIVNHIIWEGLGEVTLVGHSFGGSVITGVADRLPGRLSRLIYLDAAWLEDGQAVFDTLPPDVVAGRRKAAEAHDGGLSMPVPPPEVFGITDPPGRALLLARLTPHPLKSYTTKLRLKAPPTNGLPAGYIACTAPRYGTLARDATAAAAAGLAIQELAAPHDAMVSQPRETAEALLTA